VVSLLALTGNGCATLTTLDESEIRQGLAARLVRVSSSGHDVLNFVKQGLAHDGLVRTVVGLARKTKEADIERIREKLR